MYRVDRAIQTVLFSGVIKVTSATCFFLIHNNTSKQIDKHTVCIEHGIVMKWYEVKGKNDRTSEAN